MEEALEMKPIESSFEVVDASSEMEKEKEEE